MKKFQTWLAGLLVVQIALAGGLFWNSQNRHSGNQPQPLLSFQSKEIDKAVISGEDKNVTLKKVSGEWQLADNALPADSQKVIEQLSKLEQLKTGWPVATSKSSHERFEVAKDKFQRHIELFKGDQKVAELYLGSSPGFKQINIRRPDDDKVYSATMASYEFPVDDEGWLDRSLLAASDISDIKGSDYALSKKDKQWQLTETDGQNTEPADHQKAEDLATALSNLKVLSILENKDEAPDQPATELTVSSGDKQWVYRFSQRNDNYYVSRDDRDAVFKISKPIYDSIVEVKEPQLAGQESHSDDAKTDNNSQS
ncbi:DUF4340 domain-containing protein [Gynuella sunshinyii]|uniref:DUF4340 domain-containing protein n=1 Tax=Gynuella sunshinyii YC6258 TaxID=1445510 RepID=A0A0C5VRM3_9GAMM|nr:DUF4340 domain-containing protein [Gynuella sunshinyii]AJQ97262.1 hypothetical Protein YC6258_05232 [Gynuella sunshinyii YC6258]